MKKEINDYCEESKYAIDFFQRGLMDTQSCRKIISDLYTKLGRKDQPIPKNLEDAKKETKK